MTFPVNVERWRAVAAATVGAELAANPAKKSLLDRARLTISGLVDTLLALIQKESQGDPGAIGDNGNSIGLMQLNYGAGTPQFLGYNGTAAGLTDPGTNIKYGLKYLLYQIDRYGTLESAILAYNAGSVITNAGGVPINAKYLSDVLDFLNSEKKTSLPSSPSSSSYSSPPSTTGAGIPAGPQAATPSRVDSVPSGARTGLKAAAWMAVGSLCTLAGLLLSHC